MKKQGLKITIIGAGSSYTPELIEGLINRKDELPIRELWLVDIEDGKGFHSFCLCQSGARDMALGGKTSRRQGRCNRAQ